MTYHENRLPVGARVEWRREVYRMRHANRPIDTGVVLAHVTDGSIPVILIRKDDDGATIRAHASCVHLRSE